MNIFSDRYMVESSFGPLQDGSLFKGKDLSLQRTVLLYAVPNLGTASANKYLDRIGGVTRASEQPFMHVLDVVVTREKIGAVIKYEEGEPLLHAVARQTYPFEIAVSMVTEFGVALQDVMERSPLSFSLQADNIWCCRSGKLTVINTWNRPEQAEAAGAMLCKLFIMLLTGLSASHDALVEEQLRRHMRGLAPANSDAIITACKGALTGHLSLSSLIRCLRENFITGSEERSRVAEPAVRTAVSAPVRAAGRPAAPPIPSQLEAEDELLDDEDDEEEEYEEQHRINRRRSPIAFLTNKKIWIGFGLSVVSLSVFALVFTMLFEGGDKLTDTLMSASSSAGSVAATEPGKPVEKQTTPERPAAESKAKPADTAIAADQPIVSIPTLTGLQKEKAEQRALESGLRYTYYIETSEHAAGTVFKQVPAASDMAAKGSRVEFWVSKGPGTRTTASTAP